MKKNNKYTDVLSMVQSLSSNEFNLQFLLYLIQKEFKQRDSIFKKRMLEKYQEYCRYYFDEYTDQEELRTQYFNQVIGTVNTNTSFNITVNNFSTLEDIYFYNRWLRRN